MIINNMIESQNYIFYNNNIFILLSYQSYLSILLKFTLFSVYINNTNNLYILLTYNK